jgi:hypothetical protein
MYNRIRVYSFVTFLFKNHSSGVLLARGFRCYKNLWKELYVADWNEIKKEYISTKTSYRQLVKKYGVSLTTLQRISAKENWIGLRQQAENKTETKIVDSVAKEKAQVKCNIERVANKLINKLETSIDALKVIDGGTIKSYTSALKDLKEITNIKSDIDLKEQEARIAKLQKDTDKNDGALTEIKVTFGTNDEGDGEDWAG